METTDTSAQVIVTVQDSGPGVPVDLREAIFKPFRQAEDGMTRRLGGTGLGLAIVSDLVKLHGGTIQVDEAPGGGARFTVHLPQFAPTGTSMLHRDGTETVFYS